MKRIAILGRSMPLGCHVRDELLNRGAYEAVAVSPTASAQELAALLEECYGFIVLVCAFATPGAYPFGALSPPTTAAVMSELSGVRTVVVGNVFAPASAADDPDVPAEVQRVAAIEKTLLQAGPTPPVQVHTPLIVGANPLLPPALVEDLAQLSAVNPADTWVSVLTAHQAAQAVVGALEFGVPDHPYVLGGSKYTWRSLAESVARYAGVEMPTERVGTPSAFGLPMDAATREWVAQRDWAYPASEVQGALRYRSDNVERAIRAATEQALSMQIEPAVSAS